MEQSEEFITLVSVISSLEQELVRCDKMAEEQERKHAEIETEIENHFEKCLNALVERKRGLLEENTACFNSQSCVIYFL
jgi:hypothetical protein